MPRKVIIDCDPGIDDAIDLAVALFDPSLEIAAITATAGNVSAERASQNVQALIECLDPPRLPRIGAATAPDDLPLIEGRHLHGEDGLGNLNLPSSRLARQHLSEKIICDEARMAPGSVTVLCWGPLTNLARALKLEPNLPNLLAGVHILGGSVNGIGNVTPAAEFNVYCDPSAARQVFRSSLTKTLIPLDVTDQVVWGLDLLEQLPPETSPPGFMLRKSLSYLFRSYHQHLGLEGIQLPEVVALAAAVHPELFPAHPMTGEVETRGDLTTGATVFDRRPNRRIRGDLEVAREVDVAGVKDYILRGLQRTWRQAE